MKNAWWFSIVMWLFTRGSIPLQSFYKDLDKLIHDTATSYGDNYPQIAVCQWNTTDYLEGSLNDETGSSWVKKNDLMSWGVLTYMLVSTTDHPKMHFFPVKQVVLPMSVFFVGKFKSLTSYYFGNHSWCWCLPLDSRDFSGKDCCTSI